MCIFKKMACLPVLLSLLLTCVSGCGPKTVAEAIDPGSAVQLPQYGVQDLRSWGQGAVRLVDEPLNMDGYRIYYYKLDTDVLEAYIAMLEQNGFTLVDEHHQSSFLGSYQAYGLICDGAGDVATIDMMYSHTACHVNIWKDGSRWRIEVCDGLRLFDLGCRLDGTRVSVEPQGDSVGAGLTQTFGSAYYTTTDGRLAAKPGYAAVICDGQSREGTVTWERSRGNVTLTVEITDSLSAKIRFSEETAKQSDIFLLGLIESDEAAFTLAADGEEIHAQQEGAACFHSVTLRIMYLAGDGDTVLYLYARPMDTEAFPESIEILCAANTTPEESQSQQGGNSGGINWNDKEPFQPDHAKLDCLTCRGDGNCTTCGGDGYTGFGDAKAGCRSCHGNGNCTACGGSGKR